MDPYQTQYAALRFERAGLFEAIRGKYRCRDVLYPGCSVHITPSLYFPHVIYVDRDEKAKQFFANGESIQEYIEHHKRYKAPAHFRFIGQDYSEPLPLVEGKFDLLLALFAGGIVRSCSRYLRVGGLLVTDNHQGGAMDAVDDPALELTAIIQFRKGSYVVSEGNLNEGEVRPQDPNNRYLRQAGRGMEYVEREIYQVFERSRRGNAIIPKPSNRI